MRYSKYILTLFVGLLATPLLLYAQATSNFWTFVSNKLKPNLNSWVIQINGTATSTFSGGIESGTKIGAPFLFATSTTATSTIAGGLKITGGGLTVSNIPSCNTIDTDSAGNLICGTDATGAGGGDWPFITTANNFNLATQSTSTPLWLRGSPFSLFASSTAVFVNASTTQLTVGSDFITDFSSTDLAISAAGVVTTVKTGDWTGTIDGNNFAGGAIGAGELIYGGSAGSFSELAVSTNGFVLALSGGLPVWVASTTLANISGTLGIASGGTNATSFTTSGNGVYYNGTSLLTAPLTSAVTYPYASTTAITVSGTASTTQLTVSSAGGTAGCATFSDNGTISNTGTACGSGSGVWPFVTTDTNFGLATQSTSTPLWLRGSPFSFFASSTAVFVNASTTKLTLGSDFITDLSTGLTIDAAGAVTVTDVTCTNCLTTTEVASADLATNVSDADFGDVTVASGAWAVEDDSHAHTSTSISGLDVSADLNLTCGTNCTLTGDDISVDDAFILNTGDVGTGSYTFPYASTTALTVSNSAYFATSAGSVGIGTTTPYYGLTVASTTGSQIALSAGAGIAQWTMRNAGGNLYFSTTTVNGTATSSPSAITFNATGVGTFIGTTTNNGVTGLAVVGTGAWTGLASESGVGDVMCIKTDGSIVLDSSPVTACSGASSRTVKHDIQPITGSLEKIVSFNPVSFVYNKDYKPNDQTVHLGFIAEEVKPIEERLIDPAPILGLKYAEFIPLTVGAIQELNKKVDGIAGKATRNYQWGVIALLLLWVVRLEIKLKNRT